MQSPVHASLQPPGNHPKPHAYSRVLHRRLPAAMAPLHFLGLLLAPCRLPHSASRPQVRGVLFLYLVFKADLAEEPLCMVVACLSSACRSFQRRLVRAHRRRRQRRPHRRVAAHRLQALQRQQAVSAPLQAVCRYATEAALPLHAERATQPA